MLARDCVRQNKGRAANWGEEMQALAARRTRPVLPPNQTMYANALATDTSKGLALLEAERTTFTYRANVRQRKSAVCEMHAVIYDHP